MEGNIRPINFRLFKELWTSAGVPLGNLCAEPVENCMRSLKLYGTFMLVRGSFALRRR